MVDVLNRTCTCLAWQADDFPCAHGVAAIWKKKLEPADFVSNYFNINVYKATYNALVYPLGDKSSWIVDENILNVGVSPPNVKCPAGRPRKQRIPSAGEEVQKGKCSKCKMFGHNRRTCKNKVSSSLFLTSSSK